MTNPKQRRRMARPIAETQSSEAEHAEVAATTPVVAVKRPSKQDLVLNLLRGQDGAPLSAIVEATGWLPHTARAALTGLRKKGHAIEKAKVDGETRYSVAVVVAL
jgi:hypothetical protein